MNLIFGVRKLAKELGLNPSTIYRWMANSDFPYNQLCEKKNENDLQEIRERINNKNKLKNNFILFFKSFSISSFGQIEDCTCPTCNFSKKNKHILDCPIPPPMVKGNVSLITSIA